MDINTNKFKLFGKEVNYITQEFNKLSSVYNNLTSHIDMDKIYSSIDDLYNKFKLINVDKINNDINALYTSINLNNYKNNTEKNVIMEEE